MKKCQTYNEVYRTPPTNNYPNGKRVRKAVKEEQPKSGEGWYGKIKTMTVSGGKMMYYKPEDLVLESDLER